MRRILSCALLLIVQSPLLLAQPGGTRETARELEELLGQGAGAEKLQEERKKWPKIQKQIDGIAGNFPKLIEEGGDALQAELERLERQAEFRPNALREYLFGRLLGMTGAFERSRQMLNRAIQRDPYFFWAWRGIGAGYASQELFEQAERHFRRAMALNPDDAPSREGLVYALVQMGRHEQAEQIASVGLTRDAQNLTLRFHRARALMGQDRWRDAIPDLMAARPLQQTQPQLAGPLAVWLARCQLFSGQVEEAEVSLRDRLKIEERDTDAMVMLAQTILRRGTGLHEAGTILARAAKMVSDPQQAIFLEERAQAILEGPNDRPQRNEPVLSIQELLNDALQNLDPAARRKAIRTLATVPVVRHDGRFVGSFYKALKDEDAHALILVLRAAERWAATFELFGVEESPHHYVIEKVVPAVLRKRSMKDHHLVRGMVARLLSRHANKSIALGHLKTLMRAETDLYAFIQIHKALNHLTYAYIAVGQEVDESNMEDVRRAWLASLDTIGAVPKKPTAPGKPR